MPVISKVTSPEANGAVGLPDGIASLQASSLHSVGAVKTAVSVNVHVGASENAAVKETSLPLEENTTSLKV